MVLADGTREPIIRQPDKRPSEAVPISNGQAYVPKRGPSFNKIKVKTPIILKSDSQTWVTVYRKRRGIILIEPIQKLGEHCDCIAATGVHQVQPGKDFRILVSNVSNTSVRLIQYQCVATAEDHPETLSEYAI